MKSYTRNILNEVARYYNKMLLTEATVKSLIDSVCAAHPDVNREELENYISQCNTCNQHANNGEIYANNYTMYIANLFVDGQLDNVSPEEVDNIISWYDENKKNIPKDLKPNFKSTEQNPTITSFEDLLAVRENFYNENDRVLQLDDNERLNEQEEELLRANETAVVSNSDKDSGSGNSFKHAVDLSLSLNKPGYQPKYDHKDEDLAYRDFNWIVISPLTYKAAHRIGYGTSGWCTSCSLRYFKKYREDEHPGTEYYMIFSKDTPGKRWQIHPESNQFFAPNDVSTTFAELANYSSMEAVHNLIRFFKSIGKDLNKQNGWGGPNWLEGISTMTFNEISIELGRGGNPNDYFDKVTKLSNSELYAIRFSNRSNIWIRKNQFVFKGNPMDWPYDIEDMGNGLSIVKGHKTKNVLYNDTGKLLYNVKDMNSWPTEIYFDDNNQCRIVCDSAVRNEEGAALVNDAGNTRLTKKCNIIDLSTGHYLLNKDNKKKWFDGISKQSNGYYVCAFAEPKITYYIIKDGQPVLFDDGYDEGGNFIDGMTKIGKKDESGIIRYNYFTNRGELFINMPLNEWPYEILDEWAIKLGKHYKLCRFGHNDETIRINFVDENGQFMFNGDYDNWPYYVDEESFKNDIDYFSVERIDGKCNVFDIKNHDYVWKYNNWFDGVLPMSKYAIVRINDVYNILRYTDGELVNSNSYNKISLAGRDGVFIAEREGREYILTLDGTERPADEEYSGRVDERILGINKIINEEINRLIHRFK